MKTIAVFESDEFARPWHEDQRVMERALPWGRDLALHLLEQLKAETALVGGDEKPVEDECGWEFCVVKSSRRFGVFVHWAPLGHPRQDHWGIQVYTKRGVRDWLFKSIDYEAALAAFVGEVDRILQSAKRIQNLRWLTEREFAAVY